MARLMPITRQGENEARSAPAKKAGFKAIRSEAVDFKTFATFPPSARLAVLVGQPSEPGLYTVRVKVPYGVKLMPNCFALDNLA